MLLDKMEILCAVLNQKNTKIRELIGSKLTQTKKRKESFFLVYLIFQQAGLKIRKLVKIYGVLRQCWRNRTFGFFGGEISAVFHPPPPKKKRVKNFGCICDTSLEFFLGKQK